MNRDELSHGQTAKNGAGEREFGSRYYGAKRKLILPWVPAAEPVFPEHSVWHLAVWRRE